MGDVYTQSVSLQHILPENEGTIRTHTSRDHKGFFNVSYSRTSVHDAQKCEIYNLGIRQIFKYYLFREVLKFLPGCGA